MMNASQWASLQYKLKSIMMNVSQWASLQYKLKSIMMIMLCSIIKVSESLSSCRVNIANCSYISPKQYMGDWESSSNVTKMHFKSSRNFQIVLILNFMPNNSVKGTWILVFMNYKMYPMSMSIARLTFQRLILQYLKSRILRPCTSNTPRAPLTNAKAKLSEVSSEEFSELVISAKQYSRRKL